MMKKVKAFTLTELLVVLVIIGILVLIALPNLTNQVTKAKATEAKEQLGYLYTLQDMYFKEHTKYTGDLDELGFEQSKLKEDGGNANYIIAITNANETSFEATATAAYDFDKDGQINKWSINEEQQLKEVVRD